MVVWSRNSSTFQKCESFTFWDKLKGVTLTYSFLMIHFSIFRYIWPPRKPKNSLGKLSLVKIHDESWGSSELMSSPNRVMLKTSDLEKLLIYNAIESFIYFLYSYRKLLKTINMDNSGLDLSSIKVMNSFLCETNLTNHFILVSFTVQNYVKLENANCNLRCEIPNHISKLIFDG